jgi:hypothetical protein
LRHNFGNDFAVTMSTWFQDPRCTGRANCLPCRTNAKFREAVLKAGLVDTLNFACPLGITAARFEPNATDCINRGAEIRQIKCPTCAGNVQARVMHCHIYGECSQFRDTMPGVKNCNGCKDKAASK